MSTKQYTPGEGNAPRLPRTIAITKGGGGRRATRWFTPVGVTYSGSRGWEYQLKEHGREQRGIARVCHAPGYAVGSAETSGETIVYRW